MPLKHTYKCNRVYNVATQKTQIHKLFQIFEDKVVWKIYMAKSRQSVSKMG